MRQTCAWVLVLVAAALLTSGAASGSRAETPRLTAALGQALTGTNVAPWRSAALAVDLGTGETVFAQNADRALVPASVQKLAVSFAALRVLGPRFRFSTDVKAAGFRRGSIWKGHVFLVGHGDPTLSTSDLDALARDVAASGIRRIVGRVLGDEQHFDGERGAPGWRQSFVGIESRPLSALSVQGTRTKSTNGSAASAARAFTAALARQGVRVEGVAGAGRAPSDAVLVARDLSEPLSAVVKRMNTDSDNFVSELVLKELGATVARPGTTAAGARVVRRTLVQAGVPTAGIRIADGSGLSSFDRLTVNAVIAILRAGAEDRVLGRVFVRSLAVAGVSGTLRRRLEQPPTRKRVVAKTGTTRRSCSLAGFVGDRYAFAILQNGSPVQYWSARAAQDRFVSVLART